MRILKKQASHLVVGVQQQQGGGQLRVSPGDGVHIHLGGRRRHHEVLDARQLIIEQQLQAGGAAGSLQLGSLCCFSRTVSQNSKSKTVL